MGLETTTTIAGLVDTNPLDADMISSGDDHLRLIKAVLKATFPGIGGVGYSVPITVFEAQLNKLMPVVDNIAALRAQPKLGQTVVTTLGYWSIRDGGHGTYWLDVADTTSVDDGVTIIVATDGGRWKLVHDGIVMASQTGAKNDGLTAAQALIEAAYTAGIKHVILDSGTYLITDTLNITGVRQKLTTDGGAKILKGFDTGPTIILSGDYCEINNIEVDCNSSVHTTEYIGISVRGEYCTVSNCIVHDVTNHAIGISGNSSPFKGNNNVIRHNTIYNGGHIGIAQHTAPKNLIEGNTIYDCGGEGITIDNTSHHCRAVNNWISNCGAVQSCGGIGVDQATHTVISGNFIDMGAIVKPGICFNGTAGDCIDNVISNNTIITTNIGIYLKRFNPLPALGDPGYYLSTYNAINGNTLKSCSVGIRIGYECVGNNIKGNTFDTCTKLITIDDSVSNTKVDSALINVFARNTVVRTDVTGDGTAYTVPFDTLTTGTASDFDTATGVFTAQIAGVYMFTANLRLTTGAAHDNALISLHFSNSPVYVRSGVYSTDQATQSAHVGGVTRYMKDGDTCEVIVNVGGSTKTVDVEGEGQYCYFMATFIG